MTADPDVVGRAAQALLGAFAWVDGHADIWRAFADPTAFGLLIDALAVPWRDASVTKVCGTESRGFLLAGAVALRLHAGFVPIRKAEGLLPGPKLERESAPDYRGVRHLLRLQQDALKPADRVLLIDDWIELGSQAAAAKSLVEGAGARFLGVSTIVDERGSAAPPLGRVTFVVHGTDLPPD